MIAAELISGVKSIDEITLAMHDPKTPSHLVSLLSELRDRRMSSYERCSSYESQYNKLIFEKEKRHEAPVYTFGVRVQKLNERFADWRSF